MGKNVESFSSRFSKKVEAHPDNKDMLQAERHKKADQALRKLVQTKKPVINLDPTESSSD